MKTENLIPQILNKACKEPSFLTSQITILFAICETSRRTNYNPTVQVSRKQLMQSTRIKSYSTYHKCIKTLCDLGYIKYEPSYHPQGKTLIHLLPISYGELN